jgi:hypothetical protein
MGMGTKAMSRAKLTTVAVFPQNYFLENLAVRLDVPFSSP